MKILLTGGGSGGHFYPLIAVAQKIEKIIRKNHLLEPEIIFASDSPYDKKILLEENIRFLKLPAGKLRRYFSLLNFIDFFKTILGVLLALWKIYLEMPDIIFSKGGYAGFPVLIAARIFRIPLIIHESDIAPGKANSFAASFAKRIAISFEETAKYFSPEKIALVGNPIRTGIMGGSFSEAKDMFQLENVGNEFKPPIILILGGSQGAKKINDVVLEILPELILNYQIIHQAGEKNIQEVQAIADVVLNKPSPIEIGLGKSSANRYHGYGFLNEIELRNGYFAADLIVSRASAGAIFELAARGKPSILIPLIGSAQDHQRKNAWAYAATGAAEVIEETNFSPHILLSEIKRLIENPQKMEKMKTSALNFSKPDAAEKIAEEIISLALEHND